jgi:hypothetical protein
LYEIEIEMNDVVHLKNYKIRLTVVFNAIQFNAICKKKNVAFSFRLGLKTTIDRQYGWCCVDGRKRMK